MNYRELFQYHEKESKIFMPNEIFDDLKKALPNNSAHLAFAYSYIYLITWMYRYTKYVSPIEGFIDNGKIKELLGYNSNTKGLDYLIKKNGLLDQLGYTETVKDFPTLWTYDEFEGLEFEMYSDYKKDMTYLKLSRKFSIKYPVKAFQRFEPGELNGTFYEMHNTHCIPFEVFMFCMENEKLGTTGYYIYSYIKKMNDMYREGWDIAFEKLALMTGIPSSTLIRYIDQLRKHNMLDVIYNQEVFTLAMRIEDRKASTYKVKGHNQFTKKEKEIKKMQILTTRDYFKKRPSKHIEIEESLLPF